MTDRMTLLPCPFCGSTKAPEISDVGECEECVRFDDCLHRQKNHSCEGCDEWERPMFVVCNYNISGCGTSGPYRKTRAEAIAAWNTRAPVEYDGWFYLPKPKENIVQYGEQRIEKTEHGYKVTQPVEVIESAIRSWGDELGEYIMKRICEAWSIRSALGNGTCVITPIVPNSDMGRCSACGQIADVASNYCWRCGAKAVR